MLTLFRKRSAPKESQPSVYEVAAERAIRQNNRVRALLAGLDQIAQEDPRVKQLLEDYRS